MLSRIVKRKAENMRNKRLRLIAALLLGAVVVVQPAALTLRAEDTNTVELIKQLQKRIDDLEQKVIVLESGKGPGGEANDAKAKEHVEALDQKVKILEREKELEQEASEAKAATAPKISIGGDGFNLSSAKGDFAVQLKGVLQVDSRTFFDNPAVVGNDGLLLRRVRPIL
jgi:phosphate-selective porin OprO/OprP